MQVGKLEAGSPAAAGGKSKPGQTIKTINGRKLANLDPRTASQASIRLGQAQSHSQP